MTNKNIKRMFLFLTLLVLLVGVVSATEVANNETSTTTQVQTATPTQEVNTPSTTQIEDTTSDIQATDNTDSNVEINKKSTDDNLKTAGRTKTYTVSSYNALMDKINEAKYDDAEEVIINLQKGTYYATKDYASWGDTLSATTLTINGNGATLNGKDTYSFLLVMGGYTVNVKNTTFKNYYEDGNGGVFYVKEDGTLKVTSSSFINNSVTGYGGAIYNYGSCTVDTCKFINNFADYSGGSIRSYGTLYVYDSEFKEGLADNCGGAIYNTYRAYIYDSSFYIMGAEYGGAIYNGNYNLIVSGCNFTSNIADYGGAIRTFGPTTIKGSIFKSNYGLEEGGAIDVEYDESYISNNTFIDNYGQYGSAINIDDASATVSNNIFQRNRAYYVGYSGTIRYVKGSGFYSYVGNSLSGYTQTKYEDTIYLDEDSTMSLKYNDFDDRDISNIAVNALTTTTYGATKTVSGKIVANVSSNIQNIIGAQVSLYVNGVKKATATSSSTGTFSMNFKATTVGKNDVTVKYDGGYYYLPSSGSTTLTVNKDQLKVTISGISQKTYKDDVKITGKFTNSRGDAIGNTVLKVNVNGKTYNIKTNTAGVYTKTVKANKVGTNNITVSYAGNKNFLGVTAKKTFKTVARPTKITVSSVSQKTYKDTFTVSGRFTDNKGNAIGNTIVKINLNGKVYNAKTDSDGYYSKTLTANKVGTNNLTVYYAGNTNYKSVNVKKTFTTVARPTKITLFGIGTTTVGTKVTISGMFSDNIGNPIKNTVVKLNINGKTYNVKTDNSGVYTLNYKTTSIGSNSVTAYYPGNTNYVTSSITKYFTVTK